METNETKIKELTETIVEAITALSLGKEPSLLSNSVYKSIAKHPNFNQIKDLIAEHIQNFDGKLESSEEWKSLIDFRFKIVELYNKKQ